MTSNGNASRLTRELIAAGWTATRRAGSHMLYRCPCGEHMATVTASRTKDAAKAGPIEARIRRCKAAIAATAAA